jgi:hypothetical protein
MESFQIQVVDSFMGIGLSAISHELLGFVSSHLTMSHALNAQRGWNIEEAPETPGRLTVAITTSASWKCRGRANHRTTKMQPLQPQLSAGDRRNELLLYPHRLKISGS